MNRNMPLATAVVTRQPDAKEAYATIVRAIEEKEDEIVRTLVPTIPRERFLNVALQAITRSPRLLECAPASIIKALRDAAELGLEPSGLLGSAYLVPYKNRQTQRYEAQLIPGYRGLIDLARRSGEIKSIAAVLVRERDEFKVWRDENGPHYTHVPFLNPGHIMEPLFDTNTGARVGDRVVDGGKYIAVYCHVRLATGDSHLEVMTTAEVQAIRRRSKAADDGPWMTDWPEMAKKTVTRRAVKYLPISVVSLVNRALELEDVAESASTPVDSPVAVARHAFQSALSGSTNEHTPPDAGDAAVDPVAPTDDGNGAASVDAELDNQHGNPGPGAAVNPPAS